MNSFTRVLRLTLRYKWNLAGLFTCSLMVALFWGGNLGAVYPVVEVAFQGKSLQQWVDTEIEKAEKTTREVQQQIDDLKQKRAVAGAEEAARGR